MRNLPLIIQSGFLLSHNQAQAGNVSFTNIAHSTLQDRRSTTMVPCPPGGNLHDYVPFYFAPRSPMLYSIHRGNVEGYEEGQEPVLHLVSSVQSVLDSGLAFVFTDGHAIMEFSDFYNSLDRFDQVDWDIMKAGYWADTEEDTDRRRRRQAEFLIHERCPVQCIEGIGVVNQNIQGQVADILEGAALQTPVAVRRNWYY